MAARQIIVPGAMPSRDANGRSLAGFLRFYAPGTTLGVPKTVYKDEALTVPHDFPIPSDGGGRWPQIWAEESQFFDVAWSDQVHDGLIDSFTNIQPMKDALLASATLAQTAAEQAVIARDEAQEIATKFGDVDAAITAAQAAQAAAELAETHAETAEANAEAARDLALQYRDQAKDYRDQAEAIVGFDPAFVVRTDAAQSFDAAHKKQGRDNIGAQPELGIFDREKVNSVNVVGGVITVDLSLGSFVLVNQTAAITSMTVTNVPASTPGTEAVSFTLVLKVNGGSSFAPGAAFKPVNNVNPTLSGTANDENYLVFTTRNGGTSWAYFGQGFVRP